MHFRTLALLSLLSLASAMPIAPPIETTTIDRTSQGVYPRGDGPKPAGFPNHWIEAIERERRRNEDVAKLKKELERELLSRWDDGDKTRASMLEEEIIMEDKKRASSDEWLGFLKEELAAEMADDTTGPTLGKREVDYRPRCDVEPCPPTRIELLEGALSEEKKKIVQAEKIRYDRAVDLYEAKKSGNAERFRMASEEHLMQERRVDLENVWKDTLESDLKVEREKLLTGPV